MIHQLTGTTTHTSPTHIVLDVQGVGYGISIRSTDEFVIGSTITLHTYLAVRETALDLYGFADRSGKELFELLLSVPKIGPKSAMDVLSKADTRLLLECIHTEDPSRLQKQSGIGKKTCENIVSNLKDKVEPSVEIAGEMSETATKLNSAQTDAIDALVSLGFDPKTARDHVRSKESENLNVSELVSSALQ